MPRSRPILRLVAPAGSCREMLAALQCASAPDLIELVQRTVGDRYRVAATATQIEAAEDDERGGRDDDAARAKDLQRALGDDRVAGVIALRGGAWLTRILPRIDFDVLRRRSTRVAIFGFSELTTVINIAACYPRAVCWYDMGPAFIPAGLARWASERRVPDADRAAAGAEEPVPCPPNPKDWARQQFPEHLAGFVKDAVARIEGRPSSGVIHGRLVNGSLPRESSARIVGGTLSVLTSLIGTPYARSIFRPGRWLAIEDIREAPHRIDRMLAHLSLAGILDRCAGLLVGDFHMGRHDRAEQVMASLKHILPRRSPLPILVTRDFGHVWPMSPLPIGRTVQLRRTGTRGHVEVELIVPWQKLATRPPG
ncbi:MAG TPA: LD-carboxypeptidase [Phycisphaerae bacterium]|nr:LD-carboxypeptidase [Phycisphaerae bacterium]